MNAGAAFSVIVPAFNEEAGITAVITDLKRHLDGREYELLVVDDGSQDHTAERAQGAGARVIALPENHGYGFALKRGIRAAKHANIVITDADGTYPAAAIPALIDGLADYEMVVGSRTGNDVRIPALRRPAKWLLQRLASYLAERQIPDLNSGLRAMRRELVERYEHLLPSGFSFTTTITLAALCGDHLVDFQKINYHARIGKSKIRPHHAFDFLVLILRTIVYFNPLRVFLPLGALFALLGVLKTVYDIFRGDLSESAIFAFLAAGLVWVVGLLSDQISRMSLRRG